MSLWQDLFDFKIRFTKKELLKTVYPKVRNVRKRSFLSLFVLVAGGTYYYLQRRQKYKEAEVSQVKQKSSEKSFLKFASVQYNGQVYMTPNDFLESVLEINPKVRRSRKLALTDRHLDYIKTRTPSQNEGSKRFFSRLQNYGIISYSDYLFLLSILTRPYSAIDIAFKMLDTDDSRGIDKEEYLVMEKIFSRDWKLRRGLIAPEDLIHIREEELVDDEQGLQRRHTVDTTLVIHFFGLDGTQILNYKTFKKFAVNLQKEILELEFNQFSHGQPLITELDFAKLLIRYTYMDAEYDYDNYIDRLLAISEKQPYREQGISFEEFSSFMNFLYRLEDFYFAIRYYAHINPRVSRMDFHDAFRMLPGHKLSWHLIDTVFHIFDVDGTGYISYHDFINVLSDRFQRGFKRHLKKSRWETFKSCVRRATDKNPAITFYKRRNK